LLLASCSRSQFFQNELTDSPAIEVSKSTENRVLLKSDKAVDIIRPSGSSQNLNTSLPQLESIASVIAPTSSSSTGDVQATSVLLKDQYVYISYNMAGNEVFGAVDILDISTPENPQIIYTYTSTNYEFSDLRLKDHYLLLAGYRKETTTQTASAILMVLDIANKSAPVVSKIVEVQGIYATSMDLVGNELLINTGSIGGLSKFDVSNPANPVLVGTKTKDNGLYAKIGTAFDFSLNGNSKTTLELIPKVSNWTAPLASSIQIANSTSEAPSRFYRQNSLIYLNNSQSHKLHVLDISQAYRGETTQLASLDIAGTANGIIQDQQRLFLSQGERGVLVVDVSNPKSPQVLGTFDFSSDSGSANNMWINTVASGKFYFLADGRQGVRILKDVETKSLSNKISFFARSLNYNGSSQVSIRVNGEFFQTVELNSSDFQLYELTYSRTLTASDRVDLIFSNASSNNSWDKTRGAMVAYLKVNGNYCYVEKNEQNFDDLGLLSNLAKISATQNSCSTTIGDLLCSPNSTKSPEESCVLDGNRLGLKTCDSLGMSYTCKDTGRCVSSCGHNSSGACVPLVCEANKVEDCSTSSTVASKTCSSDGLSWGSCTVSSCKSGYTLQNGQCVAQLCTPNSSASCSITNGTGTKTCASNGLSWGSCQGVSCNSGFVMNNGVCVPQTCSPNSSQSCQVLFMNGTQSCNSTGSAWGVCQTNNTCVSGYHLSCGLCVQNVCTPNETSICQGLNGTGTKTCTNDGSAWGNCQVSTCNAGFVMQNGSCVAQTCSPKSTTSCQGSNGSGIKTCNDQGLGYGDCQITSCNQGFVKTVSAGTNWTFCSNEYESCNFSGTAEVRYGKNTTWALTKTITNGTACSNSVFGDPLVGTVKECQVKGSFSCQAQLCVPNSVESCQGLNGSGVRQCSSDGLSWGSCQINACNSGYTQVIASSGEKVDNGGFNAKSSQLGANGTKLSDLLLKTSGNWDLYQSLPSSNDPNQVAWTLSGSAIEVWPDGTGGGLLEMDSDTVNGNDQSNYSITQNIPLIAGQAYQLSIDYKPRSNEANDNTVGVYVNSTKLLTLNETATTQPNWKTSTKMFIATSSTVLKISGEGTKSTYGGLIDNVSIKGITSNSCVAQTCSPNSSKSCLSDHFIGSQTCSQDGLSWGSCIKSTSCESGYYLSNGVCVAQACSPNSTVACNENCATGTKTCNSTGSAYGSCVPTSCPSGQVLSGGVCKVQLCSPNSKTSCSIVGGVGEKTCSQDGLSYGSCNLVSCNAGYYLSNGSCVAQTCSPNSTKVCSSNHQLGSQSCNATGSAWNSCQLTNSCESGYYWNGSSCQVQQCTPNSSTSCLVPNGSGTKVCDSNGSAYGSCVVSSCSQGYYLSNGSCVAQTCTPGGTKSCSVNHFIGTQTCNSNGSAYGSCLTGTSCEAGFVNVNGVCKVQACSPNSSVSCSLENGQGVKTCNSEGTSYGSCQLTSCNAGYVKAVQASNTWTFCSNEYQSCNFAGTANVRYGKNTTWSNTKTITNGTACSNSVFGDPLFGTVKECQVLGTFICKKQIAPPHSETSCEGENGSGTKKCDQHGLNWGSCQIKSCKKGYSLENGKCVKNVCEPNSVSSCEIKHGHGEKVCDSNGKAWGLCKVKSCDNDKHSWKGECREKKDCHD